MTPEQRELRDALAEVPARAASVAPVRISTTARARSSVAPDGAPAPGDWSAREVVLHLAAVDDGVWQPRLDALAAGDFPSWPWVEPGLWTGPGDTTFEGAVTLLEATRAATVARLDALDDAGWSRQGRHATYGVLDVAALMRIALRHDEEHLAQIRRG